VVRSSTTLVEDGHQVLGTGGTITGGDDTYTWREGRFGSRTLDAADGSTFSMHQSESETYSLNETGTEDLGLNGSVTDGSNNYVWDQGGSSSYSLHNDGDPATRDYGLGLIERTSSSWHDVGVDTLGLSAAIVGGSDTYTWIQTHSISLAASDEGPSLTSSTVTFNVSGDGTDAFGITVTGTVTQHANNSHTGRDDFTWNESSSNSSSLSRTYDNGTDRIVSSGGGTDTYSLSSSKVPLPPQGHMAPTSR
jgi:hypothetical protein